MIRKVWLSLKRSVDDVGGFDKNVFEMLAFAAKQRNRKN